MSCTKGQDMLPHVLILYAISHTMYTVILYPFTGREGHHEISLNQGNRSALGNLGAPDSGVV